MEWYEITNVERMDTPALVIYPERIYSNIAKAKKMAGDCARLRPHVKTNKISEVCDMMLEAGITKYKCATIAEAEMLAMIAAPDVLLAYQPVGPKVLRLIELVKEYPRTNFSCLIDSELAAKVISEQCVKNNIVLDIFIDLNVGMDRTGVKPNKAVGLAKYLIELQNLRVVGLHVYDGHIQSKDVAERRKEVESAYGLADEVYKAILPLFSDGLTIVAGGTPTFPIHAEDRGCELSPGTFVFSDQRYSEMFPDLPFDIAAVLVSRVISVVDNNHICLDLGHKSVGADNPLPRVHFLNVPEAKVIMQNEEHLLVNVPNSEEYNVGDVLYGIPTHICPTVALYDKVAIVINNAKVGRWRVIGRSRRINI